MDERVTDCKTVATSLDAWESDVVRSLRRRVDAGQGLTAEQDATRRKVWRRWT